MFPQHWVRSCLALDTVSGLVQCVSRGELLDNRTLSGITTNVPTDLSDNLILGSNYATFSGKWRILSNKITKLEIFSNALSVENMIEYTNGQGCGDDGNYLSWDEMEWRLHGGAEIEHTEAEEICTMPSLNYYAAPLTMRSCMHLCENLGGSRLPSMNSLQQVEVVMSLLKFHYLPILIKLLFIQHLMTKEI